MLRRKTTVGVSAVLALSSWIGLADAQERKPNVDVQTGPGKVAVDVNAKRDGGVVPQGMAHRASEIHGMIVKNEAGKELGTVKDVVISVRAGQVRYAALSYGGFLGLGDKLFAVPWNTFEQRHDASTGKHTLVLNIDEETLKNAPGFDKSNWPNFGDAKFSDELEKHYGKYRKNREETTSVNVKAGPVAVDVNGNRNQPNDSKEITKRSSEIIGMKVMDKSDKEIGTVNDLMIGMNSGKVRYAALSFGGHFGFGTKLFAVPWNAFDCQHNASNDKHHLVLAVDEVTLRKAPGFEKDKWPNVSDPKFGEEIDSYYSPTRRN